MENNLIPISASRIKTFQSCSWLYACKYLWKIPEIAGEGASVGNVVHIILECLARPKRKILTSMCIKYDCLYAPSLVRLLKKLLKQKGLDGEESFIKAENFIKTAIKQDFFFEGANLVFEPEFEFDITDPKERFRVRGFIDGHARYKKEIKIRDWKTSKSKFSKDELSNNLQALIYQWVVKQLYGLKSHIDFVFVKFVQKSLQRIEAFTDKEFEGLEIFLTNISNTLANFNEEKAETDFAAADGSKKWLCGSTEEGKWCCSFRKPIVEYYALIDENGKIITSSFKKENLKIKDKNQFIIKKSYAGCRYWLRNNLNKNV